MKNPMQQLRNLAFAIIILATLAAAPHKALAAKIELDVFIPQYGYVVIKPGSNTGGAILWDGTQYYTDRVNRGERVFIYAWPAWGEITGANSAKYAVWCDSQQRFLINWVSAPFIIGCWYEEYVVPTDPAKDIIYVEFSTNLGAVLKRIPIGYRRP